MFPWGRVKCTVTKGKAGTTVLHQPNTASLWKSARESRALWRCRLLLAFFALCSLGQERRLGSLC